MHFFYPIELIIIYFAILFAPADVDSITLEIPDHETIVELARNGQTWTFEDYVFGVEGENISIFEEGGRDTLKMSEFVALPGDHDWSKTPVFTLGGGTTLEKSAGGFTIRHNAKEKSGVYRIWHHRPGTRITINVLGAVANQAVHTIPVNGTLQHAFAAAGGLSDNADAVRISIIRGAAGTVPEVATVDATRLEGSGPHIRAGDTIHVPARDEDPTPDERE